MIETTLETSYQALESRIAAACERVGRKREEVLFLPVTKTQPIHSIQALYDLGCRQFAESRVQELLKKREALPNDIHWHLIGHLQSNKARQIAEFIHRVHSIDTLDTAVELSERAEQNGRTITALVEVNISGEQQKNGVQPANAGGLALSIVRDCPHISLAGFMGMASFEDDPERTRPQFRALRNLSNSLKESHPELSNLKELSIGMSNDFEVAIEEGATIVRIGSALFLG